MGELQVHKNQKLIHSRREIFARRIREHEQEQNLERAFIVAWSGDDQQGELALSAGFDTYRLKGQLLDWDQILTQGVAAKIADT